MSNISKSCSYRGLHKVWTCRRASKFLLPPCGPLMRDVHRLAEAHELPDLIRGGVVCTDSRYGHHFRGRIYVRCWYLSPKYRTTKGGCEDLAAIKRSKVRCAFSPCCSQQVTGWLRGGSKNHDWRAQDILISTGFTASCSFLYPPLP